MAAKEAYPSQLELEEPKVYNLSLAALVGRYVQTVPPRHPLYVDHPGFIQFGDLEPLTAYYVVRAALLALALVLAWRFRRPWSRPAGGTNFAGEWAAVCLLSSLAAPVCWKQHLVVMVPALFLSLRAVLNHSGGLHWRWAVLLLIGIIFLGTKQFVLGRDLSLLALSYKVDTVAALLLLLLVLTLPETKRQTQTVPRRALSSVRADAA
jgi:hypothetical protein